MGVFDKFLDIMKLNDDEDFDDEFYDEEFEEELEEKPARKSFFKREKEVIEDEFDLAPEKPANKFGAKVTPMRSSAPRQRSVSPGMEVCVVKPTTVEDSRQITETLLNGRTVILNLEGLDLEIAQRIIDFTSGAAFAISGSLQKISNYIFLVTPTNVDITGDLQDLLGTGSMDPVRSRY